MEFENPVVVESLFVIFISMSNAIVKVQFKEAEFFIRML